MGIGIYTTASFMITKVLSQRIGRLTMSENIHIRCMEDGCARITVGFITLTDTCVVQTKTYPKVFCAHVCIQSESTRHMIIAQ